MKGPLIQTQGKMSQRDSQVRVRRLKKEKGNRGRRDAAGDGAISRSVNVFKFG